MNYGKIIKEDVANGEGIRLSLFVSGCHIQCKGCFNPQCWDFNYGEKFTDTVLSKIIKELNKEEYKGLTILGGEPMSIENQEEVNNIIKTVKKECENKDIWLYTGYELEDLMKEGKQFTKWTNGILKNIDVIVVGAFVEELKDLSLRFRGSSNQRIIKLRELRELN